MTNRDTVLEDLILHADLVRTLRNAFRRSNLTASALCTWRDLTHRLVIYRRSQPRGTNARW